MSLTPAALFTIDAIRTLMTECFENSEAHGFWEGPVNDGEKIALIHAELSEALEYLRNGNGLSDHIPEFLGVEEEFADVCIRIFDLCAKRNWRLGEAIIAKMEFNNSRPHKHGKAF